MKPINEMNLQECLGSIRKGNYLGRYELADRILQLNQKQSKRNEELSEALMLAQQALVAAEELARQFIVKAEGK